MSPDNDLPRFQRQQLDFTAHIRDPEHQAAPPDIPRRRMQLYNELFFNNANDQLSTNFPVLRSVCDDAQWCGLVRDFMVRHRCSTPYFTEIAQEFIAYLQDERDSTPDDWPFMLELAHYEWVELAVSISTADELTVDHDPNGDLLSGIPVIGPTAWSLTYVWPVHMIGPEYLPDTPPGEPTHLVVYRDRQDQVHFLQINAVTQRLLQLAKEKPQDSGLTLLTTIAEELAHPDPATVIDAGSAILHDLRERNVLLGTRI